MCVCVTTYTPKSYQEYIIPSIRSAVEEMRKQFYGFNHMDEIKWVELKLDSQLLMAKTLEPARSFNSHYFNYTSF